jgi:hypothetical protein
MAKAHETRGAGERHRARNAVCFAANSPENSRIERPPQAQKRTAVVLRFPPLPGRLEVRITAARGREPIGRTRPLMMALDGGVASPTQGQAFFYFGDRPSRFEDIFSTIGFVVGRRA